MDNINLSQYFSLEDKSQYQITLSALKPINKLGGNSIDTNKLTYKDVRSCFHLIKNGKTYEQIKELFKIAYSLSDIELMKCNVVEFFHAQNYLYEEMKRILEKEYNLLKSIDTDSMLWEQAGGQRLNKFSNLIPLIQLGEIYHIYPFDLENKPYNEILVLLVAHKNKNEVHNNYSKLKNKQ